MASYIEPIRFALIVFPFLALAISSVFFIYEYRKYGTFLVTRAVILYSNVLLLIPFGIYLRYYFRLSFMKTMIASFCLSLFFELTQLSGLYFIYPRPYRLFDVNDLVTNTLGGIIGFVVTPLFTFMLPTRRRMDELSYEKGKTVSLTRRLVAYLIDWTFLSIVNFIAAIFFKLAFDSGTVTSHIWWLLLEVGLYFMIVPFITNGWTLGKKIVRIRLVEQDRERISLKALIIRYGYLYFLFYGLSWLGQLLQQIMNSTTNTVLQMSAVFISLGVLLLQGIFILNILLSFLRKKRILFYEKASHTYTVSTIAQTKDDDSRN